MIVVSDTGPIQYLVITERISLLETYYEKLLIPPGVVSELSQPKTPTLVRTWMSDLPLWAAVQSPITLLPSPVRLGIGEVEAISLAYEQKARLLVDDQDARRSAVLLSIPCTGTLGILMEAHADGLFDIRDSLRRLRETSFRLTVDLADQVINIADKRRHGKQ